MEVTSQESSTPVEQWMEELDIHGLCGCGGEGQCRRFARTALFKKMALKKMQHRYEKYAANMLPAEKEVFQKTIDAFQSGSYSAIRFNYSLGTFYTPLSPLLWLLQFLGRCKIFFGTREVLMGLYFLLFKKKDIGCGWGYWSLIIMMLIVHPLVFPVEVFLFFIIFPLLVIFIPLVELILLVIALPSWKQKYHEFGVFRKTLTVRLVLGAVGATKRFSGGDQYSIFSYDAVKVKMSSTLTHLPLKGIVNGGHLEKIFADMDARYFSFGTIDGEKITEEDNQMFIYFLTNAPMSPI